MALGQTQQASVYFVYCCLARPREPHRRSNDERLQGEATDNREAWREQRMQDRRCLLFSISSAPYVLLEAVRRAGCHKSIAMPN